MFYSYRRNIILYLIYSYSFLEMLSFLKLSTSISYIFFEIIYFEIFYIEIYNIEKIYI